jgi:hypothetical protein
VRYVVETDVPEYAVQRGFSVEASFVRACLGALGVRHRCSRVLGCRSVAEFRHSLRKGDRFHHHES